MKKNYFNKIAASLFLISAMLFASCSGLSENINIEEMATISVSIADTDAEARLIKPTSKLTDITDIVLKGTISGGSEETLDTWATYTALSNAAVQVRTGNWSFVLTCKKGNESFTGTTSATITSGENTNLSFVLSHVTSANTPATGTASGTVKYPQGIAAQTVVLDISSYSINYNSTASIYRVFKTASEIQNNSVEIVKENLAPGKYVFEIGIFNLSLTEAQYNAYLSSGNTGQLQSNCLAYEKNAFEIAAGCTTDISQNLSYLAPEVADNDKGFKSVRALTDADGKGYIEFVVKWPKKVEFAQGNSTAWENTNAIEICRDGNTVLGYSHWGSDPHPSTVVLCDRYELTAGQEYTYKLRYNYKWQADMEFEIKVTASADGFTKPNIVCPNTSFDGRILTCTNLNESDLQLDTRVTQAERNRISGLRMNFDYYDPEQPDDWGSTRIYTGFDYRNNTPQNLWTSERSGITRKIYHAKFEINYETIYGSYSRQFHIADGYNNVKAWAGNKLADTLVFATSSGN